YSLYVYLRTNTLKLMVLLRTSADGQPPPPDARTSHLRTLSKIPGFGLSASPIPSAPKCPREPHIIQGFYGSSTPCVRVFFARLSLQPGGPTIVGEIAAAQQARCASCRGLSPPEPALSGQNSVCRPAARPRNRVGTRGRHPRPPRHRASPRAP